MKVGIDEVNSYNAFYNAYQIVKKAFAKEPYPGCTICNGEPSFLKGERVKICGTFLTLEVDLCKYHFDEIKKEAEQQPFDKCTDNDKKKVKVGNTSHR